MCETCQFAKLTERIEKEERRVNERIHDNEVRKVVGDTHELQGYAFALRDVLGWVKEAHKKSEKGR